MWQKPSQRGKKGGMGYGARREEKSPLLQPKMKEEVDGLGAG